MKKVAFFSILALLLSCEVQDEQSKPSVPDAKTVKDTTSSAPAEKDTSSLVEEWSHKQRAESILGPEMVGALVNFRSAFEEAQTDSELEEVYSYAVNLTESLTEVLINRPIPNDYKQYEGEYYYVLLDSLFWLKEEVPGLLYTCVAECTQPDFTLNIRYFREKAENTSGTNDDLFFKILQASYGEEGKVGAPFGSWFSQTWDYGGASLLGNNIHLELLKLIDEFTEKGFFRVHAGQIRNDLFSDMLEYNSYMNSPEEIASELKMILSEIRLSPDEIKSIKTRIEEISNYGENDIQVNCEEGNCSFG